MIRIEIEGIPFNPDRLTFSGGEIHSNLIIGGGFLNNSSYKVDARIKNADDIMELMLVSDILRHRFPFSTSRILFIPYIPYARQDRRCTLGDSLSIKVFTNMINSLHYDKVIVVDPHSDVAPALINNCFVIGIDKIFNSITVKIGDSILVSPDAGANKKVSHLAYLYKEEFIRADKKRDVFTGEITGTEVFCSNLEGQNCFIVDDICDGGRTFIELAKVLKKKGAGKIYLYVTHGIFSKGLDVFDGLINHIYTTDSFYEKEDHRVTIIKLENINV